MYNFKIDSAEVQKSGCRKNLAKSGMRALDILEYFATTKRALRAIEISKALSYHTSSTDQLLKTMVDAGYLVFDANRKLYMPSPRLIPFADWLVNSYYGPGRLKRLLQSAQLRTGAVITLAVQQKSVMQVIDIVHPATIPRLISKGSTLPVTRSALGYALMAGWANDEVESYVRMVERRTPNLDSYVDTILRWVEEVRTYGFSTAEAVMNGVKTSSIAIRLPGTLADVPLVLGLGATFDQVNGREREMAAIMQNCIGESLLEED